MKKIIAGIVLSLLFITNAIAADAPVWFAPVPGGDTTLTVGDDILIYAKVNNTTKDAITYTLAFTAAQKTIGTKITTVPGYTEQSVSVPWTMPQDNTLVTASITKAVGKDKKEIPTLKGTIGTVTVTTMKSLEAPAIPANIKGFIGKGISAIETWRVKELDYFTKLKAKSKGVLGETTVNDISTLLRPDVPATPGSDAKPAQIEDRHTTEYVTLIYATAGESFFAHKAFFYVVIILGILFVIRSIFRMFF